MARLFFLFALTLLSVTPVMAASLNQLLEAVHFQNKDFEKSELEKLKGYEVILISGVMAEIATTGDKSAPLNFSLFSGDYFGEQVKVLESHHIDVKRIQSSSRDIEITKANIKSELANAKSKG